MRNLQLTLRIFSIAMVVFGIVVAACDMNLTGNLADALAGQPASLGDNGTAFTVVLLMVAMLLVAGGILGCVLSFARRPAQRSRPISRS